MKLAAAALTVALAGTLGCRSEAREQTRAQTQAGDGGAAEWWCGAVKDPARVVEHKRLGASGQPLRLGLVADAKEPLPATLQNLERFAAAFQKERVHAVIALGGLGSTEDEIAKVLLALKPSGSPILALPGDREPEGAFHAAVARAKKSGLDVIDLADVRAVAGDGLEVISLPGYRFPSYLGARAGGCRYRPSDVDALAAIAQTLDARAAHPPRILVAHTPPRGVGPSALDWALGGANIGDPELARALEKLNLRWGAFAHVDEAGGRGWNGHAPVEAGAQSPRLYVNAGAADSVPHDLAGGAIARGQAALLQIDGEQASFRVIP
ncbi:MAG TPA: hypothetical protein VFF06_02460 [Polyangia bacterium]|nr:hypothetical protein [Polyangia bacterium]